MGKVGHIIDSVLCNFYNLTKFNRVQINSSMHKAILLGILVVGIASVLAFTLMPASLSAVCMPTFWQVPASEAPQYDENQNGFICKYVRPGSTPLTVYLDD